MFRLIGFGICCISFGWTTAYVINHRHLLSDGKALSIGLIGILTTLFTCFVTFYTTNLLIK
jgi:hypothetical protein